MFVLLGSADLRQVLKASAFSNGVNTKEEGADTVWHRARIRFPNRSITFPHFPLSSPVQVSIWRAKKAACI